MSPYRTSTIFWSAELLKDLILPKPSSFARSLFNSNHEYWCEYTYVKGLSVHRDFLRLTNVVSRKYQGRTATCRLKHHIGRQLRAVDWLTYQLYVRFVNSLLFRSHQLVQNHHLCRKIQCTVGRSGHPISGSIEFWSKRQA
jgi:hypothetical protein